MGYERSKSFLCSSRRRIKEQPTTFSSVEQSLRRNGALSMAQVNHIESFVTTTTENGFHSERAPLRYIAVNHRQDVCARLQKIAERSARISETQFKSLGKAARQLKGRQKIGLCFVRFYMASGRVVVLSDAPFGNTIGMKHSPWYVIVWKTKNTQILFFTLPLGAAGLAIRNGSWGAHACPRLS